MKLRSPLVLLLALSLTPLGVACKSARSDAKASPESTPVPDLPQLVVKDDSEGLTFSYITLDGGFQLAKKVSDVPYEARDAVRVWSEVSGDGIVGPWVYVADLRNKLADGTYKVEVVARTAFEQLADDRRKKSKAVAQKAPADEQKGHQPGAGVAKVKVIIYGADWCKPCHLAEAYLKKRGIPFEHRDIDEPEANEEMKLKLQQAGIKTHSIPVLDVNGKLLVGFSEPELDKAIEAAGG